MACAVAALLVAAGVAAGVPACGGVGFGLVTGFAAGISVVGLMEMFGFIVAVFVFTAAGVCSTALVSVVDVPGAGASPPPPPKPIANLPNPAKYFMGKIKTQPPIGDKTICCQPTVLPVASRPWLWRKTSQRGLSV